jgi:uncharacterized protein (DUF1800 family)
MNKSFSSVVFGVLVPLSLLATDPPLPAITNVNTVGTQKNLRFAPYPGTAAYTILGTTNLALPFTVSSNFTLSPYFLGVISITNSPTNIVKLTNYGYEWRTSNNLPASFYRLQVTPMNSNAALAAHVLNRLAYGPTPDELPRVMAMGADQYIAEQISFETLTETVDSQANIAAIAAKFGNASTVIDLVRTLQYDTNGVATNAVITSTNASISDLRAWHTLRAVGAKRQLLEVLLQFLENHFVTQVSKSSTYFNGKYNGDDGVMESRASTQLEYLENYRWRQALLSPSCTFSNLLTISAESLAMIIYLDTVSSAGNGSVIANENYARELMELFTMGVDNGYDQNDITTMSRCWTGWTGELVDSTNAFNRFAIKTTMTNAYVTGPASAYTNLAGVWTFIFKSANHNTAAKSVFYTTNGVTPVSKQIPTRFGPPWAGRNYGLYVPSRTGNNGIQDGYDVIAHLCNQPFTEEYISVKLCRLFVHDDFETGYDFTDPNLSPEGHLVHDCMLAWENATPKGNIRTVLSTIFNSDLFRSPGTAMQKAKTPLEFVASVVRSLRSSTNGTTFTADTDGTSFATPMNRMGGMNLFDRGDPNGYPEDVSGWISGGTLAERIRFVQAFCIASGQSGRSDAGNCVCNPVTLLNYKLPQQIPPGTLTNSTNVADYFVSILFPAEGAGNLTLYRNAAIKFLETSDTGAASAFSSLSMTGSPSAYENRVRGMVGMLMSFARFQEQ